MAKIILCAAFLATLVSLTFAAASYSCDGEDEQITYNGNLLLCPKDKVCNKYKISTLTPCTTPSKNCFGQFTCTSTDPGSVKIDGIDFRCQEGYFCNKDFEAPCEPCIREKCKAKFFDCVDGDPTKVTIQNMGIVTCTVGVCNKDNIQPCTPCVTLDGAKGRMSFWG